MSVALSSTSIVIRLTGGVVQTFGSGGPTLPYALNKNWSLDFTNGTGANQSEMIASIVDTTSTSYSVVTGSVVDIDLEAVTGPFDTEEFDAIKTIALINKSTTSGENIIIGGAASNAWDNAFTGTIIVPPGGLFCLSCPTAAGWVVDGTHSDLRLRSATGTPAYELHLLGIVA